MNLKLLFLTFLLGLAPSLQSMHSNQNSRLILNKCSKYYSMLALPVGIGSLGYQLYNQDFSLKKSLFTGGCLFSGLISFLTYKNLYKKRNLENYQTSDNNGVFSTIKKISQINEKIKKKLENGASPDGTILNQDFLSWALKLHNTNLTFDLLKKGARVNKIHIIEAIEIYNYNNYLFDLLIEKCDDINDYNYFNTRLALHKAASRGKTQHIKKFLELGCDINYKDECGYTPLLTAISCGKNDIVKFFIKLGANLNITSNVGETLLEIAEKRSPQMNQFVRQEILIYKQETLNKTVFYSDQPNLFNNYPAELIEHIRNFTLHN